MACKVYYCVTVLFFAKIGCVLVLCSHVNLICYASMQLNISLISGDILPRLGHAIGFTRVRDLIGFLSYLSLCTVTHQYTRPY